MTHQAFECDDLATSDDDMALGLDAAPPLRLPWADAVDASTLQPKFDLAHMWAGDASKLQDGEPVAAGVVKWSNVLRGQPAKSPWR